MLPADLEDALHGIVRHNLSVSFEFTRNESGEYPNIKTFSASIINSNPKGGAIASSNGWFIQGKGSRARIGSTSRAPREHKGARISRISEASDAEYHQF